MVNKKMKQQQKVILGITLFVGILLVLNFGGFNFLTTVTLTFDDQVDINLTREDWESLEEFEGKQIVGELCEFNSDCQSRLCSSDGTGWTFPFSTPGKCLETHYSIFTVSCSDSESGIDFGVKGKLTFENIKSDGSISTGGQYDSCTNEGTILFDYICDIDDRLLRTAITVSCDKGCVDGACVDGEGTPLSVQNLQDQTFLQNIRFIAFSLREKIDTINSLTSDLDQLAEIINGLELTANEQAGLISELTNNIDEQAQIISQLELTSEQQANVIESLTININEQAEMINELTINLQQKADLVNQLQATNEEQASLIKAMELSFSEQGEIISALNNEISDDVIIIQNLDLKIDEQAILVSNLKLTNEEQVLLIESLDLKIDEQIIIIDKLKLNLDEKKSLLEQFELTVSEKNSIIFGLEEKQKSRNNLFIGIIIILGIILLFLLMKNKKSK